MPTLYLLLFLVADDLGWTVDLPCSRVGSPPHPIRYLPCLHYEPTFTDPLRDGSFIYRCRSDAVVTDLPAPRYHILVTIPVTDGPDGRLVVITHAGPVTPDLIPHTTLFWLVPGATTYIWN